MSGTPTLLGTYYDTTKGRRNIGIRAGYDSGVWVDGTQIFNSGPALASNPVAGFGSQAMGGGEDYQPGLTLFENLTYTLCDNCLEFVAQAVKE